MTNLTELITLWLEKNYDNKKFIKTVNDQTIGDLKSKIPDLIDQIEKLEYENSREAAEYADLHK